MIKGYARVLFLTSLFCLFACLGELCFYLLFLTYLLKFWRPSRCSDRRFPTTENRTHPYRWRPRNPSPKQSVLPFSCCHTGGSISLCVGLLWGLFSFCCSRQRFNDSPTVKHHSTNFSGLLTKVYLLHPQILNYTAFNTSTEFKPGRVLTSPTLAPLRDLRSILNRSGSWNISLGWSKSSCSFFYMMTLVALSCL